MYCTSVRRLLKELELPGHFVDLSLDPCNLLIRAVPWISVLAIQVMSNWCRKKRKAPKVLENKGIQGMEMDCVFLIPNPQEQRDLSQRCSGLGHLL